MRRASLTGTVTPDMLSPAQRKIADAVGIDAMLRLCEAFGGTPLYIPTLESIVIARRNAEMRRMHTDGARVAEIADRFGLSTRSVQLALCEGRRNL